MASTAAALDCGTNALRLLVVRREDDGSLSELSREMRTVRLGEGVDARGEFSSEALERTFAALEEYADIMHACGVQSMRMVATSASRDVSNRQAFVDGTRARIGIEPEVITGDEEALLSFAGACGELDIAAHAAPYMVVDIGGGSTEFVFGADEPVRWKSVDVGCVRMTERHLVSDPPTRSQIDAAERDVRALVAEADRVVRLKEAATLIGLAGSVTTVAAWALDLPEYDAEILHGSVISREDVERATAAYLALTRQQRAQLPYMHPGRVDVIAGGAMVLREIMRQGDFGSVLVSEHDLLDGIACTLV